MGEPGLPCAGLALFDCLTGLVMSVFLFLFLFCFVVVLWVLFVSDTGSHYVEHA